MESGWLACLRIVVCCRAGHCVVSLRTALVILVLSTPPLLGDVQAGSLQRDEPDAVREQTFRLDLREQPLVSALDAFAAATATELIYDAGVITPSRSGRLEGQFTAAQGLTKLLSGTGLAGRRIGPTSFTIEQARLSGPASQRPDQSVFAGYFGAVQHAFAAVACEQTRHRPAPPRLTAASGLRPTRTCSRRNPASSRRSTTSPRKRRRFPRWRRAGCCFPPMPTGASCSGARPQRNASGSMARRRSGSAVPRPTSDP